jgi:flagellum-specific ATP synthase
VRELLSSSVRSSMVIVAATSDKSPMERARGAKTATAIAESFRDEGKNVLLVIDSVTRYAMALREIGLSVGEPPATKGYPPSVFAKLPMLLERVAPMQHGGSITAFYTVLVEGDDLSDPVADSARSLLDGHIVLSREHAARGQFPAVDVLASTSRVSTQVTTAETQKLTQRCRSLLSMRKMVADLQSLGAYVQGSNPDYDLALALGDQFDEWAAQTPSERFDYDTTMIQMAAAIGVDLS